MKHMVVAVSFVFLMALVSRAQTTEPSISPARIAARKELGALGVEYSGASFVKQASEGDTIAVKLFLEAGMNPDVTDKDGYTALAKSAGSGFRETVQLLIAAGAKVDVKGPSGDTPLIAGDTPLIVAAQN
ncbi:MAG TPA: ankyrin repeat domain-containing protein, partial [Blastocatellia bacterium]|nr:ankyrin repeat domain-containing protein [Blastocatellia bacterium]